jgi:hypothetical protein
MWKKKREKEKEKKKKRKQEKQEQSLQEKAEKSSEDKEPFAKKQMTSTYWPKKWRGLSTSDIEFFFPNVVIDLSFTQTIAIQVTPFYGDDIDMTRNNEA